MDSGSGFTTLLEAIAHLITSGSAIAVQPAPK